MSSFQAKIVWKRQRKRENKNPHSVPFRSRRVRENFKNIGKKLKKLKKIPLQLHFRPKFVVKGREREKIKILVSSQNRLKRLRK